MTRKDLVPFPANYIRLPPCLQEPPDAWSLQGFDMQGAGFLNSGNDLPEGHRTISASTWVSSNFRVEVLNFCARRRGSINMGRAFPCWYDQDQWSEYILIRFAKLGMAQTSFILLTNCNWVRFVPKKDRSWLSHNQYAANCLSSTSHPDILRDVVIPISKVCATAQLSSWSSWEDRAISYAKW